MSSLKIFYDKRRQIKISTRIQVFQAKDLNLILTLCKSSSAPEVPKK